MEPNTNTSSAYDSSTSYNVIGQEFRPHGSRLKVLMQRVSVLFIFVLVLVCGVLVRVFVHIESVPGNWTELCTPITNDTSWREPFSSNHVLLPVQAEDIATTTVSAWFQNTTLPYCNETRAIGAIHYLIVP